MTTENKKWFVIITKPKAEKKVGKRLTELGIENFVPLHRQLRQWHDRKKWVDIPLFNSYIFVKIEEKHRTKVFEVIGVLKYLSIGGQISVLREQEIERIKKLCAFDGEIEISDASFEVGEEVEIISGHFCGFIGILISADNKNKLKVHFSDLNCFATVEIEKKYCRKLGV
jgi:transcription antitermination factor NusG